MRAWVGGEGSTEDAERLAHEALPQLEAAGDDAGLSLVWDAVALVANTRAQFAEWAHAGEAALTHMRRAGRPSFSMYGASVGSALGPQPASEALVAFDGLSPDRPFPGDLIVRALLLAMLGRTKDAWAVAQPAWEHACELGHRGEAGWMAQVALLAGDVPAAAAYLEIAWEDAEKKGIKGVASTVLADLSRVLCQLDRYDEAQALAETAHRLGDSDDVHTQVGWRRVQALVCAYRGEHAEAERLAHEAVSWARRSDSPGFVGDACYDLGDVLEAAGRREEAIAAWQDALDCYERKGIIPLVRRTREKLATLEAV